MKQWIARLEIMLGLLTMNIIINTVHFTIPFFLLKIIPLKCFSFDRETETTRCKLNDMCTSSIDSKLIVKVLLLHVAT